MDLAGSICDDAFCNAMFFAIGAAPFVFAGALTITLLAKKVAVVKGKVVPGWVWGTTFVVLLVILLPVAYGVLKLREHALAQSQFEAAVRSIDYQTYWPAELPEGFEVAGVGVTPPDPSTNGGVTITYDTPVGYIQAFQSPTLGGDDPRPEDCRGDDPDDPDRTRIGTSRFCRVLVTPEGNEVVIATSPQGCEAGLEIGATRLALSCLALDDDSIARYFDSMEPIDPMDIEFHEPRIVDFF